MAEATVSVSVVYALPNRQTIARLTVPSGTSVAEAVTRSGLRERFPEIARDSLNYAIYGRTVAGTERVADGDRIEILRALLVDPKESRRQAAARARRNAR